jgi:gamma-polyglutamate synthase
MPRHEERTQMEGFTLGTSDDAVLLVVAVAMVLLFLAGIRERRRHRANLARLPLRISVNGSRGKSTVTRLLTGALAAGGYRPLGKTTGTEPKLLFGWSGAEEDVTRRPEGPNISEQRHVVQRAVDEAADVLVSECMAVSPEYQRTFHADMLDVNLLVICNALEDHLDEMGPTSADVAEVFAASFPAGQKVVVTPEIHLPTYRAMARERGTELLVADPDAITEDQLRGHQHLVLPDHVALVLTVTRDLGIPDEVALRGMRDAPSDPYAMKVTEIGDPADPAFFVNGFAANDPASTLAVWEHIVDRDLPSDALTVIINCRDDRMDRTQRFASDVLPALPIDTLVVTGRQTRPVLLAANGAGDIDAREVLDLTDASADEVVDALRGSLAGRIVYGVGNLHGGGTELVQALEALAISARPAPHPSDPLPERGVA